MAIISDNDMEIILKGSKEQVIRKMLNDRLFCLISMPIKKPDKCISKFSSSVFVSHMTGFFSRTFAVRNVDENTLYEDCETYLSIADKRGCDTEQNGYFEKSVNRIIRYGGSITKPTINELIDILKGKELVLITNYMHYGNFEQLKVKDFLEDLLLLWKESGSKFIRRDETCDIRIYLRQIEGEGASSKDELYPEDIRDFDIRKKIVNILKEYSKKFYFGEEYYSAEYEAQTKDIQAAYFVTRFCSNNQWSAHPVCIVNARISAFVLPGVVSKIDEKDIPKKQKTRKKSSGANYVIDSIHCNSDIFYDFSEFDDYMGSYFCYFGFD